MTPALIVLDEGKPYDLFDVLEIEGELARVRSPFLFEIGEELSVRIERDGEVFEAQARVRGHVGPAEMRITELELSEQTAPRRMVTG
ncbi:MAG: hypothetical protein M4D80_40105 [Myxococcota bacterium]|nr:hypothetical protein [Deltaproteobacteria bacterium]MDQ3341400.1 hypothetical protein [Myxococcota bacterium]